MNTLLRITLLLAALAPSLARAGSAPGLPAGDGPPGVMRVGMGGPFHGGMPFGDDPGLMVPMLLQGVGLTDDQKKQIRDILKADHASLFSLFEQLAPRQREVFVLRHVEGWSTREVADAIGVETGSVKRHLFRAIRHLRTALGEES